MAWWIPIAAAVASTALSGAMGGKGESGTGGGATFNDTSGGLMSPTDNKAPNMRGGVARATLGSKSGVLGEEDKPKRRTGQDYVDYWMRTLD